MPRVSAPVVSEPNIRYIASSILYPFIRTDIVLPPTLDEAEVCNGLQIYDDMATDPTMSGLQLWAKTNALADGLTIMPREIEPDIDSDDPSPADVRESKWAAAYMRELVRKLEVLDRPVFNILWNMMDGIRLPHKMAEVTYDTMKTGVYAGYPCWSSIRPKPRRNYNFIVDEMMTFRGVMGLVPGGSQALWTGIIFDASQVPNAIAPEKLITFSGDDVDGNPLGRSMWNGCYSAWARLQRFYMEHLATGEGSAGGKVSVVLGEDKAVTFTDPDTGKQVSLLDRTDAALAKWGNNGTLTLGPGSTPMVWFPDAGALAGFESSIAMIKREMAMGFLTNARAVFEAEHGSKADTEGADEDVDPVKGLIRTRLCNMLNRLFYNTLKLARGEEYAMRFSPVATMNKAAAPDFAVNGTAFAAMVSADAVTPSQWAEYCTDKLGTKPPTIAEMKVIMDTWMAQKQQIQNPPEPSTMPNKPIPVKK